MDKLTSINVMNWNGRSLRNKAPELFDFMIAHHIDLAIISETWLQPNVSFSHGLFSCIRQDRDPNVAQRGGGVMIVIRKGIPYERIDHLDVKSIEAVGIVVRTSLTPIRIIAAYYPGGSSRAQIELFRRDLRKLLSSNDPLFVTGDFNARHRTWNCSKANKPGNILYQSARNFGIIIHVPDSHTFIPAGRGKPSTLDLTLSNSRFNMSVPKVVNDLSSDHLPVTFTIDVETPFTPSVHQYRCYNRADWSCFRRHLDSKINLTDGTISTIDCTTKINEAVEFLTKVINEAEALAVPLALTHQHQPTLPESVKLLIKLRNTRRRQYYRRRDPLIGMIVSSLNQRIQKEVAEHRFRTFGAMVEDLDAGSNKFWKISKLLRNKCKHNPPLKVGDSYIASPVGKAEAFAESFANAHVNTLPGDHNTTTAVNESILEISRNVELNNDASTYTKPKEIRSIIRHLK